MATTAIVKPDDNLKLIYAELNKGSIQEQLTKAISNMNKWVTPDKMIRVAMTAIRGDEKLMISTPVSIIGSVIQLAQVGLVPDGFLGQAYLVPYFNKEIKRYEASPLVGYRGYGELAVRSGKATSVDAHVIYAGDLFEYEYGSNPFLRYKLTMDPKKRGDIIGAFACVYMKEGPHRFEIMPIDQIEKVKGASQGADSKYSPWITWYEEMVRKTPMRRLAKWVPLSPEFQMAAGIDEAAELGTQRTVIDNQTGQVFFVPTGKPTESAIERPSRVVEGYAATAVLSTGHDAGGAAEAAGVSSGLAGSQAPAAANCHCSCCKNGMCNCATKGEFDACGCKRCLDFVSEAKKGQQAASPIPLGQQAVEQQMTPVANQPLGAELFPQETKSEPSGPYIAAQRIKKVYAVARGAGIQVDANEGDTDQLHKILKEQFNISSVKKIPEVMLDAVLKAVGGDKLKLK